MLGLVLIVDDDASIRALVQSVLEADGWTVVEAANGREALDSLDQHDVDAIVLDLDMPVLDGRGFYREMAKRRQPVPTLILAANSPRRAAYELGATAALQKPFDIDVLSEMVIEVARNGGSGRCDAPVN